MSNDEVVRIYLNDATKKKNVLDGADPHQKYIILMNDTLQADNKKCGQTIKCLQVRIEELENENEHLEKNHMYTKSLLKNFHEMNKWHKEISARRKSMIDGTQKYIHEYKHVMKWRLRYLQAFTVLFFALCYQCFPFLFFAPMASVITLLVLAHESYLRTLSIPTHKPDALLIKNILNEIKKTTAGQDYIYEFIDQQ